MREDVRTLTSTRKVCYMTSTGVGNDSTVQTFEFHTILPNNSTVRYYRSDQNNSGHKKNREIWHLFTRGFKKLSRIREI